MSTKIMVFIPMYNCAPQISKVLAQFTPEIQKHFVEIVVVDNRSTDDGLAVAQNSLKLIKLTKMTLLQNKANYNLGGSHKVAFNYFLSKGYDYCVVLHGDDQADIADLMLELNLGEYSSLDCLLGARFHKKSKLFGYSKYKILGNIGLNFLCSLVLRYWVQDMGSGLNMYSRRYLQTKFYLSFPNDLTFNVYMLFQAVFSKAKIKNFPISWREEDQVSNAKVIKQTVKILKLILAYLVGAKQLFRQELPKTEYLYSRIG